jgi:HEAT repeat protein
LLLGLLVQWLGTANLLVVAAGLLLLALGMQAALGRAFAAQLNVAQGGKAVEDDAARAERRGASWRGLLRNPYIVLIFGLLLAYYLSYYFTSNIFYDRATLQYPDADQLAGMLGVYTAVLGFLGLGLDIFVSGRVLERFGLSAGLFGMPSVVVTSIAALVAVGALGGASWLLFGLAVAAQLGLEALVGMWNSAFTVLYQPLPAEQRLQTQTIAEGIFGPLVMALAGLLLLVFNTLLGLRAVALGAIFLIFGVGWLVVTLLVVRRYPAALAQALARRKLGEGALQVLDSSSLAILQQELNDPHPEAALYALHLLEQQEGVAWEQTLIKLLNHPAAEVRMQAVQQCEHLGLSAALPAIRKLLGQEASTSVREAALRALAVLGESQGVEEVSEYLHDPDLALQRGALVGLLTSGSLEGVLVAGERLLALVKAPEVSQRLLAAQVLGNVGVRGFYRPLVALLDDPELEVRAAALLAAGKVRHPRLWPAVMAALGRPKLSAPASQALLEGLQAGDAAALAPVQAIFRAELSGEGVGRQRLLRLVRVCGRARQARVLSLLEALCDHPDAEVRTQVLAALHASGHRPAAQQTDLLERFRAQVRAELTLAAWVLACRVDLGVTPETALLAQALQDYQAQVIGRLFYLLSFIYDERAVLRAREALLYGSVEQHAYALEALDLMLERELKTCLLPMFEALPPAQQLLSLNRFYPQMALDFAPRLAALLVEPQTIHAPWLRACALYTAGRLGVQMCLEAASAAQQAPEPLVRETAGWALAQLKPSPTAAPQGSERTTMLTTIEKVIILKTVNIFEGTPDAVLSDVASLLEEIEVEPDQAIITKGEIGASLYIIVHGRVRVHDGETTLNYLGARDVFGEMALLDPQPRMASVTTVEETLLFRLAQEPFYDLMENRIEVARGIIQVLCRRLRALTLDITKS